LYSFFPKEIEGFSALAELALDLRWSWNHAGDEIWHILDPALWESTHNPWVVLQTVSRDRIERALADKSFRDKVEALVVEQHQAEQGPAWFQHKHADAGLNTIAYFSMEYMVSEALPIYSGGLGNVAGDQLKTASNLGVPVVGVGLLYQRGYFRQAIDQNGDQLALFPYNDPGQLPVCPLREENGEWLRLEIPLPGYSVWLRAWEAKVGRVKLYLLDSNDAANHPAHRGITSELYGGGLELRLKQEIMLGLGGWRLLEALGIKPEVCHLNEGHAALAVLDRARSFMLETGQPFDVALAATRAGNLFTTHTPVPAGFDRFPPPLVEQHLRNYAHEKLHISFDDLLALGRLNRWDSSEPFNMAYLAIHGSGAINGVSQLHGKVSRRIFQPLFPRWPQEEVPVGYVTNGVHMPTWDSVSADDLWTKCCGKSRWLGTTETMEKDVRSLSDRELWESRSVSTQALIDYARVRQSHELMALGAPEPEIEAAEHLFDRNALTLGFARRFATYKRPNLLLHDPERLLRILTNPAHPTQLIIAGKAHPADEAGKALIREWVHFIRRPEARPHVVFLADYDMYLTLRLVEGVDVWINTPRRPWEACGTSGMKVLVNGGINLSELDGWWAEAYTPEVGWALGDGKEHGDDDPVSDAADAEQLYTVLEQHVIPEFYTRDRDGIPTAWVARMRESMARLTPQFSANRSVSEYTENYYIQAARNYRAREADGGAPARKIVDWQKHLETEWSKLYFGGLSVQTDNGQHRFEVQVYLDEVDPNLVQVELYAMGIDGGSPVRQPMERSRELAGGGSGYVYTVQVAAERPASDYTARLLPYFPGALVPLEASHILWQR
jgi:starch phosphorylase